MIAVVALTVAAAAIIGAVELGRLQFQRARTLARIRSLPAVPLPAGAAGPSVSHNPGVPRPSGPAAQSPHATTTPAVVAGGPADPNRAGQTVPGARRHVHAERGRPSTAGPGPRGGGPGQPPTARPVRREPTGRVTTPRRQA